MDHNMNSSISDGISQEKQIELLQLFQNLTEALRLIGFYKRSLKPVTLVNILPKSGEMAVCPLFGQYFHCLFLSKTPTNPLNHV